MVSCGGMAARKRAGLADEPAIVVRGAREHNLRNVNVELPRDKLVVFTGISGSGKSSLAFDTIYAEGQRRYVESLVGLRPPVPRTDGQARRRRDRGPVAGDLDRSEVGEQEPPLDGRHDHRGLRLPPPALRRASACSTAPTTAPSSSARPRSRSSTASCSSRRAPASRCWHRCVRGRKGEYDTLLEDLSGQGYVRARIDGETVQIDEFLKRDERLARYEQHKIEVVVDRLVLREGLERRLTDSLETALGLADGVAEVELIAREGAAPPETLTFSQHLACPVCGTSYDEPAPRNFSFNSPYGACEKCDGLGTTFEVDPELVVPDPDQSLNDGAISPWRSAHTQYFTRMLESVAEAHDIDLDAPWGSLTAKQQKVVLFGTTGKLTVKYKNRYGRNRSYSTEYEGVIPWIKRRHEGSDSDWAREQYEGYMRQVPCGACGGARLKPASLAVTVNDMNIAEVCELSIGESAKFLAALELERARSDDRRAGHQGGQRPARVPPRRRARLPHAVALGRHARRRRGAAHPARQPDRLGARGHALRARRTVGRAAPARQPPPHRHAHASARSRQHGDRRRARRGDDPRERLGRRHRSRRRRARRRGRLQRPVPGPR